jgi:hypothetical protein
MKGTDLRESDLYIIVIFPFFACREKRENKTNAPNDNTIPDTYGSPIIIVNSQPATGGPIMRPSESNEDKRPVALPCPTVECFVISDERHGRITPFPTPKMDKYKAAVKKSLINKINAKPIAETIIPL